MVTKKMEFYFIRDLYEFGLDYEAMIGSKSVKARELVAHFGRRELLDTLLTQLAEERPHVNWHAALLDTGALDG